MTSSWKIRRYIQAYQNIPWTRLQKGTPTLLSCRCLTHSEDYDVVVPVGCSVLFRTGDAILAERRSLLRHRKHIVPKLDVFWLLWLSTHTFFGTVDIRSSYSFGDDAFHFFCQFRCWNESWSARKLAFKWPSSCDDLRLVDNQSKWRYLSDLDLWRSHIANATAIAISGLPQIDALFLERQTLEFGCAHDTHILPDSQPSLKRISATFSVYPIRIFV